VQLCCGIVVSIDPDTEHRAGSRSKKADTTTKGVSRLSATIQDMERCATKSLGSNKGKRKKRLSSSPLPSARPLPKQKRGKSHATLVSSALLATYILYICAISCSTIKFCISVRTRQIVIQRLVGLSLAERYILQVHDNNVRRCKNSSTRIAKR